MRKVCQNRKRNSRFKRAKNVTNNWTFTVPYQEKNKETKKALARNNFRPTTDIMKREKNKEKNRETRHPSPVNHNHAQRKEQRKE
jgi:hypothetical protein